MTIPVDTRQLVFDLGTRAATGRSDFLLAPCNADAIGWVDRWPEWPASVLVIHGPAGSGKSHLAAVWQTMSGAARMDALALEDDAARAWSGPRCVVVEDLRHGFDETALLHLVNTLTERGGQVMVTAAGPPNRWGIALPDLASRLALAPNVALGDPDDTLLGGLFTKLLADRQVTVAAEVVSYLLPRVERSFAAARRVVEALDAASLSEGRPITVPLARSVLATLKDGSR